MRSLNFLLAILPLSIASYAPPADEVDTTIVVTATRTITFCPIATLLNLCHPDEEFEPPVSWTIHPTASPYPTGGVSPTSKPSGWSAWPSSTSIVDGSGSSSTKSQVASTTSGYHYGNGTTTSTSSTATHSSGSCTNQTFTHLKENKCNSPHDRASWCGGKSVDSDTHEHYKSGDTKTFNLVITNTTIDFDGEKIQSFAINGQSPGPAIEVNWGDKVVISVTNLMENNATTIHWHGIRQIGTNDQDGVPGVSECGIAPGQTRVYTWHASTYGTGWYHSHMLAQFGGGVRGPIIIHGPASSNYDVDMGTVMVDDKFEATIFQMAYRTARFGQVNTTNYFLNGKNKSPDLSRGEHQKWTLKPGKKHLFRIINSSAQNSYAMHFDSHTMKVIAADFTPIVPYDTEWLYITNGQRYDVIIEANQPKSAYFFRAVNQRGCPSLNYNTGLGHANGIVEYEGVCDVFPTPDIGSATPADFNSCKDEPLSKLIPRVPKNGGTREEFQEIMKTIRGGTGSPVIFPKSGRVFQWFLNGNKTMNVNFTQPTLKTLATMPDLSYNSSLYSNAIPLMTGPEDWVYFVLQNSFRVSHPMHLHGHDFSLLGQGPGQFTADMISTLNFENPIRRDTGLLFGTPGAPSGYTVIGFQTDNPGAWLLHCHIIWHSDGGMALQYIERPDEIDAKGYYRSDFKGECKSMEAYEASGEGRTKKEYESGLKKRVHEHLHSHMHAHVHDRKDVVRH